MLTSIEKTERVPCGKLLFREGEQPRGVYVVREGELDLVFSSKNGEARALRVAEAGQILGISCVIANKPHDCSATAKTPSTVGFIEKEDFQRLLGENPDLWLTVLQTLSSDIGDCWNCMRSLGRV
jgi:CRP-like cAMP-binding protein